jgi:hypothetical protein
VQLSRITCPLMLLTASADHLVPPSQTEGIVPYVGSKPAVGAVMTVSIFFKAVCSPI